MPATDWLRSLLTPDGARWKPMMVGLALFAAGSGAAVHFQEAILVSMMLSVMAFIAWCVGAFAMVGFVRWMFAAEVRRAKREREADGK